MELVIAEDTDFVKFWNSVLEPKFTKYRHILQGGLSRHSAAVLPNLPIKKGMSVLDVGCGWGDMSLQVAEIVGPSVRVVGIDCVEAFLEEARKDAAAKGLSNSISPVVMPKSLYLRVSSTMWLRVLARCSSQTPSLPCDGCVWRLSREGR